MENAGTASAEALIVNADDLDEASDALAAALDHRPEKQRGCLTDHLAVAEGR